MPTHRTSAFQNPARVLLGGFALLVVAAQPVLAQDAPAGEEQSQSLLQVIQAGGPIGYVIILLSLVGLALVIDGFLRVRADSLLPPDLIEETQRLAQQGKFSELRGVCKSSPSLWGGIVGKALEQGNWGVDAVREAIQQEGTKQFTRLRHRVGYIGLIASIAPLLGLLGTVTGMIQSFQVLGISQTAGRADELAAGIAEALITTCMGLIVAMPLLFLHAYLRDRVTQISQEAATQGERLIRVISVVHANNQQRPAASPAPSAAPRQAAGVTAS